ncbi:MAG: exosortase C-terminal domain/associated protein EpsI [Sphingomicrobium sp.]
MASTPASQEPRDRATPALSRREFVVAGALGATAIGSYLITPRADPDRLRTGRSLEQLVPNVIGSRTRSDLGNVLIPKGEGGEKSYDQVLTRYYAGGAAAPIMLLIAYGSAQVGNTQLHRPEVCYPAAGFKMRSWPDVAVQVRGTNIAARSMTALATGRIEQILYWSRVGPDFPTSSFGQRWAALRETLRGSIADGVLVRISTIDANRAAALPVLRQFATELVAAGGTELRLLLTGKS